MTANFIADKIIIHDATSATADVASGAIPRPRERREGENAIDWLKQTPAWCHNGDWPGCAHLPVAPAQYLGLGDLSALFLFNNADRTALLAVNPDGTRYALLDLADALADAWARLNRQSAQQSLRAKGKSGPKRKPIDQLSPSQQWRRRKEEQKNNSILLK